MKYKFFRKHILLLVLLIISASIVTIKSLSLAPNLIKINGIVEFKHGDKMPRINNNQISRKASKSSRVKVIAIPGKIKPINDNIYIPIEDIPSDGIIAATNSSGEFIMTLKPGRYTFFILKDNEAYRNSFDEKGFFTQTNINADTNDLILTYDKFAFF